MQSLKAALCSLMWPAFAAACHHSAVACAPATLSAANWPIEYTPDSSISLRLPPGYHADPLRGGHQVNWFWHTSARGTRLNRFDREVSLTVSRSPGGPYVWPTRAEAREDRGSDPSWVDYGSSCTASIGGRNAFVQAGLVSGGFMGMDRVPSVQADWAISQDSLFVHFQGEASDLAGQEEIMTILSTVRFHTSNR